MVGYNAQRNVRLFAASILDAGYFADLEHYVSYCIDFEQVAHALHYACQTLEAHARVDVGMRKPCIVTLTVAVKLREYKVPKLHIAVAVAARLAFGAAAAVFGPSVEMDFRAGAARTCTCLLYTSRCV